MDWLLERQEQVEGRLARRHLKEGELALYDVSSSYFEGRTCSLARFGYDHGNGKRGRMQVEYGLLCDSDGRPVAIEAFEGSVKDDKTLPSQVKKLEQRFGLTRVIVVTDRGIGTKENVTLVSDTAEFAFITALKAPQVKKLVKEGCLQLSVFDEVNLAEIACEQLYPGQRLVVCRNPLVAADRARTRRELLQGTEKQLAEIKRRVEAGTLQGQAEIGLAVGAVWNRYKVKKHFQVNITDDTFTYERKHEQIALEAELDGIYVIRAGRIKPRGARSGGDRARLQAAQRSRKGLRRPEGPAGGPPDPPPPGGPRPRPPADLPARRVPALAPAPRLGRAALPGRQPRLQHRPGRQGRPLARGVPQGRPPPHPHPRALPHAPQPLRRAREPHPQHDPRQRQRRDLPAAEHPDRAASARARADR